MEAQPSPSLTTTTAAAAKAPAVTDEELDAFLATRPWRDRIGSTATTATTTTAPMSDDEQDQMLSRMLSDPAWSSSMLGFQPLGHATATTATPPQPNPHAHLQPPPAFPPPTSSSLDMEWESREPTFSDPRKFVYASPASFEAQFFEGTPEQDALLQALADQQQQRDQHEQEQQQRQLEQHQQRYRQYLLEAYDAQPSSQSPSGHYAAHMPDVFMQQQQQPPPQQPSMPLDYTHYSGIPSSSSHSLLPPPQIQRSMPSSDSFYWRAPKTTRQPPINSPNSDVFSSPEMLVRRSTHSQHRPTTMAHSPSSLQQHPSLSMASSSSHLSHSSSSSVLANLSPVDVRHARRSSSEIRALQQRRQVRRTYAGPSPSASLVDVANTGRSVVVDATPEGRSRAGNRAARPLSSHGPTYMVGSMSASYSSAEESSRYNDTYSITSTPPPHAQQRHIDHVGATVPTSLSAELAGLGIDPDNLYGERQGDLFMDNDESGSYTLDTSAHQTSSSSSASMTRVHPPLTGDNSLFSQNTTFSSGLDESLQSHDSGAAASSSGGQGTADSSSGAMGQIHSSRWVHGRDTPPSTPSRGSLGPSPSSIVEAPMVIAKPASVRATETAQQQQQQQQGQQTDSRLSPYPRTWPRAVGEGTSVAAIRAVASAGSSKQQSPVESTGSGFVPDVAGMRVRSPVQAVRSETVSGRVTTRPRRTPSSASSSSSSFLSHFDAQSGRQTTRHPNAIDANQASSESLSSRSEPRSKRWSSVILTTPSTSSQHDAHVAARRRRAATGRLPQPEQYEQVSAALETLRTFLRQRERPAPQQHATTASAAAAATNPSATPRRVGSNRSIPFSGTAAVPDTPPLQWTSGRMRSDGMFDSMSAASTSPSSHSVLSSTEAVRIPSSVGTHSMHSGTSTMTPNRSRTLRHPPPGPLPPRGSLQPRHTPGQASPTGSNATLDSGHGHYRSADADMGWHSAQSHHGGSQAANPAPPRLRHRQTQSSTSMDRIAALDDLSERVRRMRDEEQLQQQQQQQQQSR